MSFSWGLEIEVFRIVYWKQQCTSLFIAGLNRIIYNINVKIFLVIEFWFYNEVGIILLSLHSLLGFFRITDPVHFKLKYETRLRTVELKWIMFVHIKNTEWRYLRTWCWGNPTVHYRGRKSAPAVPILNRVCLGNIFTASFFKIHLKFNIIRPSAPMSSKWSPRFVFSDQNVVRCCAISHECYMPHHFPLDLITPTIFSGK
jgi:hypothetical protein